MLELVMKYFQSFIIKSGCVYERYQYNIKFKFILGNKHPILISNMCDSRCLLYPFGSTNQVSAISSICNLLMKR